MTFIYMIIIIGTNTSNFTALNQLFIDNPNVDYWRFEVVYIFTSEISSSSLSFIINHPPQNGSCSINPLNGTTSTLFTISCLDWFDEDEIIDYSLYGRKDCFSLNEIVILGYTRDRTQEIIIAFSSISEFEVRLPFGDDNTSILNLFISIRDTLGCITEFNMSSIIITPDLLGINDLINTFQNSIDSLTINPFIRLLSSENQNTVGQILTSLSQQFNKINIESLQTAVSSKYQSSFYFSHVFF
jgi:hypothetical protein